MEWIGIGLIVAVVIAGHELKGAIESLSDNIAIQTDCIVDALEELSKKRS